MEREIITNGMKNFISVYEVDKNAPNIIFIMTPLGSVDDDYVKGFFKGLTGETCNVFALDFLGIGKSEGTAKDISIKNMECSVLSLIKFIKEKYNDNIHFYGGTGAGGIIGQAMVSNEQIGKQIKSFIQYGVCIYKDTTTMGSSGLFRVFYSILKILNPVIPEFRIKFKVPPYDGFNAKEEAEWYESVQKINRYAFDFKVSLFKSLLDLFFDKKSNIKNEIGCPVLILAPKYDRYYYREYIDRYYNNIRSDKELYWINGSHISFDWLAQEINTKVLSWVWSNS